MKISISDLPKQITPDCAFFSIAFFGEKLMSKKLLKKLNVDIFFIKDLKKLEKFEADCIWEDINIRPKEFSIRIDSSMSGRRIIQALAHEMTHIKQYATGEMSDLLGMNTLVSWRKGLRKQRIDSEVVDYWEHPWEIEAYGREKCLTEMFKTYWRDIRSHAEEAYKTQPDSANTPHTFILKTSSAE